MVPTYQNRPSLIFAAKSLMVFSMGVFENEMFLKILLYHISFYNIIYTLKKYAFGLVRKYSTISHFFIVFFKEVLKNAESTKNAMES